MTSAMKALRTTGNGSAEVQEVPMPAVHPEYVLVRTKAVALNPTDWKHVDWVKVPTTMGVDFAGIIEEVGPGVKRAWKKGDRVFGITHGSNIDKPEIGAFGEYLVAKGDVIMQMPDWMSFEEAATMPVGVMTNIMGLWQQFGLPRPGTVEAEEASEAKRQILIYGGSTATGMHAIQTAKLSGFEVIATASPRNFDLLKSLGADHVFDYRSPTVGADINKLTSDKLLYAWDTISEGISPAICSAALASSPVDGQKPKYGAILLVNDFPRPKSEIDHLFVLIYTVVGDEFTYIVHKFNAVPEDRKFWQDAVPAVEKLIAEKEIKPHRFELRGGLEDIPAGLDDLRYGRVSGTKLICNI